MKTWHYCAIAIAALSAIAGCDKDVHEVLGPTLAADHVALSDPPKTSPDRPIMSADVPPTPR
jgi:hypothetical protein